MKKWIVIAGMLLASSSAYAQEPQWEVDGFPISQHQLSVLMPKNVREVPKHLSRECTRAHTGYPYDKCQVYDGGKIKVK